LLLNNRLGLWWLVLLRGMQLVVLGLWTGFNHLLLLLLLLLLLMMMLLLLRRRRRRRRN
jgi:type III secretory pathway component EscV